MHPLSFCLMQSVTSYSQQRAKTYNEKINTVINTIAFSHENKGRKILETKERLTENQHSCA